ncbi:MAG: hypothetical protein ACE5F7_01945 [Nitrospiria bacterium]
MKKVQLKPKDLLLAKTLSDTEVATLLRPYGFRESLKADANLQAIAENPRERLLLSEMIEEALTAFSESPDPDLSLHNFERFTQAAFSKIELLSHLKHSPLTLYHAAFVFGASPFFADILVRNPGYFYWVFSLPVLEGKKSKASLKRELSAALRIAKTKDGQCDVLRIFKRKEILRIGVRDLVGAAKIEETLKEVSNLADVLIEKAHAVCEQDLRRKHGRPTLSPGMREKRGPMAGFAVIALGKLGSRELNFSSDVDLIYVYDSREGETDGGRGTSVQNAVYYERLAKTVTAALNQPTGEGYVYRVDLRLRPEGEMGLITQPLEGYRRYYQKRGATWERMVLLRARTVSGDRTLGKAFLSLVDPFVFEKPCGAGEVHEIRCFKKRIDETVELRKQLYLDVKRGFGGIREIEFIVQTLQLQHGCRNAALHHRGTISALKRLGRNNLLPAETTAALINAYRFLRNVENKLQMLNDRQTHLLPTNPAEVETLARRLGYDKDGPESPAERLHSDLRRHTRQVHQAYEDLFAPAVAH